MARRGCGTRCASRATVVRQAALFLLLCASVTARAPHAAAQAVSSEHAHGTSTAERPSMPSVWHDTPQTLRGAWALASKAVPAHASDVRLGAARSAAQAAATPRLPGQAWPRVPDVDARDTAAAVAGNTQSGSVVAAWDSCQVLEAMPYDWLPVASSFIVPQRGRSGNVGYGVQRSPLSWMGGDCDTSIRLNSTAYLWLFGDTLLGTWSNGAPGVPGSRQWAGIHMPHQSVAVMAPSDSGQGGGNSAGASTSLNDGTVSFFWRQQPDNASMPLSMFTPGGQAQPGYFCETVPQLWPRCDYLWMLAGGRGLGGSGATHRACRAGRIQPGAADRGHPRNLLAPPPSDLRGPLLLLASRIITTPGQGLGFDIAGTTAMGVDNPDDPPPEWTYRVANVSGTGALPGTKVQSLNWYTAVTPALDPNAPDMTYILGSTNISVVIARTNLTALALSLDFDSPDVEYWVDAPDKTPGPTLPTNCGVVQPATGSTSASVSCWTPGPLKDPDALTPVLPFPVSETTLEYSPKLGLWYIPYIKGFSDKSDPDTQSFGDTIDLWTAPNATGPFQVTKGVYHIPIPPTLQGKVWCYAAKAHPELAAPQAEHLVLTYVCNAVDVHTLFGQAGGQEYTPKFVYVNVSRVCTPSVTPITPAHWTPTSCDTKCGIIIAGIVAPCLAVTACAVLVARRTRARVRKHPAFTRRNQPRDGTADVQLNPSPAAQYDRLA